MQYISLYLRRERLMRFLYIYLFGWKLQDSLDSIPFGPKRSAKENSNNYSEFLRQEFSVDALFGVSVDLSCPPQFNPNCEINNNTVTNQIKTKQSGIQYPELNTISAKSLDGFLDAK